MVIGSIYQTLRLRALPTGWRMLVKDVRFHDAGGGWYPGLLGIGNNLSITKVNYDQARKSLPIEITMENNNKSKIGEMLFSSQDVSDSGRGPSMTIDFELQGSGTSNGKEEYYARSGTIDASTSDWGYWERPDYVSVRYSLDGGSEHTVTTSVPTGGQPGEVGLVVGWNSSTKSLGLNASNDGGALDALIKGVSSGNFEAGGAGWSRLNL